MKIQTDITNRKVLDLLEWVGDTLLPDVDTLTICNRDALLRRLSRDVDLSAISVKAGATHCYNIYLRDNLGSSLMSVICHELWHIVQFENGDLDYDLNANTYTWKGETYGNIPYAERPWEKEAFANTILSEYKNS